jgi:hypothetical protein
VGQHWLLSQTPGWLASLSAPASISSSTKWKTVSTGHSSGGKGARCGSRHAVLPRHAPSLLMEACLF